jgi:hypothetical protein
MLTYTKSDVQYIGSIYPSKKVYTMTADFYTGSIVPPEDLWFRDEFIEQLWEKLHTEHVLLTAPRRTGKTSVMNHLRERPQAGRLSHP